MFNNKFVKYKETKDCFFLDYVNMESISSQLIKQRYFATKEYHLDASNKYPKYLLVMCKNEMMSEI